MSKHIAVVIPAFNRIEMTMRCLESLDEQDYKNHSVIVVDDGSTDGTMEAIQKRFPKTILVRGNGNLWWSGSMNLGIKKAIEGGAGYILALNNDLAVDRDYLSRIVAIGAEYPHALIGSVAVSSADADTILDGGCKINTLTAKRTNLNMGRMFSSLSETVRAARVDVLTGRGTLIPREVFEKIGSFNEAMLPQYGADYEFSIRAARHGYSLFVSYTTKVIMLEEMKNLEHRYSSHSLIKILSSYFDRKSSNCLIYRWRFACLSFGFIRGSFYYLFDTFRSIGASIRMKIQDIEG